MNEGIGGRNATLWVKYDLVDMTSATPVLVDIAVSHWPNWVITCGPEWEPAGGTNYGIQGALTAGTEGLCWRNGLCVRYSPANQVDSFVSAVSLSRTGNGLAACPPMCEANRGYWTMQADTLDIHRGCEDDLWFFLCSNRAEVWPPMPTSIDVPDDEKAALLETYAPRIWLAAGEAYYPSSVEWSFPYSRRYRPCDELPLPCSPPFDSYWLRTKAGICDSDVLAYFAGDAGAPYGTVPVYAFWREKTLPVGDTSVDMVDLVYFLYYPYNRGKEVLGTTYGHHVGDWEHVSVRLSWVNDPVKGWSLEPVQIYLPAHDFGRSLRWGDIAKVDGTHAVVYGAEGSHGIWPDAGCRVYKTVDLGIFGKHDLVDCTSEGAAWDTWLNVETYDFGQQKGLGASTWPIWMSNDFTQPCAVPGCDPADPASGAIFRWGNTDCGSVFGNCRLCTGPTGPVSKGVWDALILE